MVGSLVQVVLGIAGAIMSKLSSINVGGALVEGVIESIVEEPLEKLLKIPKRLWEKRRRKKWIRAQFEAFMSNEKKQKLRSFLGDPNAKGFFAEAEKAIHEIQKDASLDEMIDHKALVALFVEKLKQKYPDIGGEKYAPILEFFEWLFEHCYELAFMELPEEQKNMLICINRMFRVYCGKAVLGAKKQEERKEIAEKAAEETVFAGGDFQYSMLEEKLLFADKKCPACGYEPRSGLPPIHYIRKDDGVGELYCPSCGKTFDVIQGNPKVKKEIEERFNKLYEQLTETEKSQLKKEEFLEYQRDMLIKMSDTGELICTESEKIQEALETASGALAKKQEEQMTVVCESIAVRGDRIEYYMDRNQKALMEILATNSDSLKKILTQGGSIAESIMMLRDMVASGIDFSHKELKMIRRNLDKIGENVTANKTKYVFTCPLCEKETHNTSAAPPQKVFCKTCGFVSKVDPTSWAAIDGDERSLEGDTEVKDTAAKITITGLSAIENDKEYDFPIRIELESTLFTGTYIASCRNQQIKSLLSRIIEDLKSLADKKTDKVKPQERREISEIRNWRKITVAGVDYEYIDRSRNGKKIFAIRKK